MWKLSLMVCVTGLCYGDVHYMEAVTYGLCNRAVLWRCALYGSCHLWSV